MYRDGGTREIVYENGMKFYTPSGLIGLPHDVYAAWPKEGSKPVNRELAIEILSDMVNYYSELYHTLRKDVRGDSLAGAKSSTV